VSLGHDSLHSFVKIGTRVREKGAESAVVHKSAREQGTSHGRRFLVGNRDGFGNPGAQVHYVKKVTSGDHMGQINRQSVIELQCPGDGCKRTRQAGRRALAGVAPVDCRRHGLEHLGILRTHRPQQLVEADDRAMPVLGVQL